MSASLRPGNRKNIRNAALALGAVAAAFYFGFIVLLVVRSHH
jgi:hypothetical protein